MCLVSRIQYIHTHGTEYRIQHAEHKEVATYFVLYIITIVSKCQQSILSDRFGTFIITTMDTVRDIKRTDQPARFLDGHSIRTNPFGRNLSGEKAYRRAERLVTALHLVTVHVSTEEPVRATIRKVGLRLLTDILLQKDEMRTSNSPKIRNTLSSIRELISLTRILMISGLISTQNGGVIVEALDELGNFIAISNKTPLSETIALNREDLVDTASVQAKSPASAPAISQAAQAAHITDINDIQKVRDTVKDKTTLNTRTVVMGPRARFILDILLHGELGIKDISSQLPEYSEKMIQRELLGLVREGKVKKSGFKRWSKYSLA